MSRLDDILHSKFNKNDSAYWLHYDQAKNEIKQLMIELIGDNTPEPNEMRREVSRRNAWRNELRDKVFEL